MPIHHSRFCRVLLAAPLLWLVSGCAGAGLLNWNRNAVPTATAKNPAVEAVAIWQAADGTGIDGMPTRGIAGQILFFTRGTTSPVKVDGDARIYLFDDQGTADEQSKPLHQFDFPADVWNMHLKMSALGPSYHVFIPYVRKQPYQAQCTLRVRFKAAQGPVIFSDVARITLPGPLRKSEEEPAPRPLLGSSESTRVADPRQDVAALRAAASKAAASRVVQASAEPGRVDLGAHRAPATGTELDATGLGHGRQIVQAAGTADLPPAEPRQDPQEERLRRLERMVEQLLEARTERFSAADASRTPHPGRESAARPVREPRDDPSDADLEPRRFRLEPAIPLREARSEPIAVPTRTSAWHGEAQPHGEELHREAMPFLR